MRPFGGMILHAMSSKIARLIELHGANVALVRFVRGMKHHVLRQVPVTRERLVTLLTLKFRTRGVFLGPPAFLGRS